MSTSSEPYDLIILGTGNAGFSAAASAASSGLSRILVLEKSPPSWIGGNTTFTAGAYRTSFSGLSDVLPLVTNCPPDLAAKIDMPSYPPKAFMDDLVRITEGKTDPALAKVLVERSRETTGWLAKDCGIRFVLSFNRQAYEIDGRWKFWGGMVLAVEDGGKGLTRMHSENVRRRGVEVRFESEVEGLVTQEKDRRVKGVRVRPNEGEEYEVFAKGGVVMAAGGFEASREMRQRYLGEKWGPAYVRGTPYNTGDLLGMALELGAARAGHWEGCHSTCWDANAPKDAGSQELTNQYTKSGYPLGVMINTEGRRFVDEGEDMRNYTYAKFGREILGQPGGVVFQVWDADGVGWLRGEEYAEGVVERVSADTVEELAQKLGERGLKSTDEFVKTLKEYNAAVEAYKKEHPDTIFDPSKKDGMSTRSQSQGLHIDKTNWAVPILKPPFLAVKVTCGITFTFGGLKIEPETAKVLSEKTGKPIPGLYCAGEMVGGLFYGNYPGGSGLTSGAVFGRIAGKTAAESILTSANSTEARL